MGIKEGREGRRDQADDQDDPDYCCSDRKYTEAKFLNTFFFRQLLMMLPTNIGSLFQELGVTAFLFLQ